MEDWTRAVVKGADDRSPRWRHVILLGGILLGLGGDHREKISQSLRQKLEAALVTASNMALEEADVLEALPRFTLALVLNHTFELLSDLERNRLHYDALLPLLIDAIYSSREGLGYGAFLSAIDADITQVPGRKFQWSSQSPSFKQVQAVLSKPLVSALGPLSRLVAHSLENVSRGDLVVDAVMRIMEFTRAVAIQWRQNKLSEVDRSEEAEFLDMETIHSSLPALWQVLRSCLFSTVIILRAVLGRVLNDQQLANEDRATQISIQSLHALRNLYFVSSRLGQTSTAQYQFVTYTAIDILNMYGQHAERFLSAIRPSSQGQIPTHPVDRCLDLFFLNTAEHFTLSISPQVSESLLLAAATPYLAAGGNNSLLEIFEAAHSLTLAIFSAPQNVELTTRHLPFYIDTLFEVFPANLSDRQFRFAFKALVTVVSEPSALASEQPILASVLLQILYDRAWDAPSSPLPPVSTNDGVAPSSLSEQSALIMALLDALPYVSPHVLEEWLPLAAALVNRVSEPQMRKVCQERFWDIMSSGEMDVRRATIAVTWWTSRGGREMVLFGDAPVSDERYMMSGALESSSKL